ncbi:MAG: LD-carboxypeptidase, partial [Thermoanaerobaculum sp.]|nr:LD-carboxypeptidase [Thermoanaerobaculum sp.]
MNQAKPLPPPLVPHEIVGVWAPASPPRQEEVQRGVAVLEQAGFRVLLASNLGQRQGYLAGDDDQRLQGLLELLERGCRALWAVRGGYGVMRLLPRLPWEMLSSWGGFLIGYSDLTALHAAALGRFGWATVHGPMITSLGRSQRATARILELVQGRLGRQLWRFGERQVLRPGYATGLLVGGNLSLLASLVGTPYEPPWDGVVLAVE